MRRLGGQFLLSGTFGRQGAWPGVFGHRSTDRDDLASRVSDQFIIASVVGHWTIIRLDGPRTPQTACSSSYAERPAASLDEATTKINA
jgi:hypothetical protein